MAPLQFGYVWMEGHCTSRVVLVATYVCLSASFIVYSVLSHGFFGQTLGKRLAGVVVLDLSESPLSMKQAILRDSPYVVMVALLLPFEVNRIWQGVSVFDPSVTTLSEDLMTYALLGWSLLEIITAVSNPMRRAIHDYLAGSVVVLKAEVEPSPFFT